MCGIAGLLLDQSAEHRELAVRVTAMNGAQRFRGPDDEGTWIGERAALGCVRLAIVGRGRCGLQPIVDPAGGRTVFNGEIYNHRELADELEQSPPPDASDGWVLARLLERRGKDAARSLRGMFAIARHDSARGTVLLVRDALGKKPLYVRRFAGGWAWGSTLAAIAAGSGPLTLRPGAIEEYLVYRSVGGNQCAFLGVEQLPAGGWMELGPGGCARRGRWWTPPPVTDLAGATAQTIRDSIDGAVRARAAAEPHREVALLVSGGLDSAIVAASARRQLPDRAMSAWSVGYDVGDAADETAFASRLASALDAPLHRVQVAAEEVPALLFDVARYTEDPIQDPVTLPTLQLVRAVSSRTRVALSGDGSDETWGGYARFDAAPSDLGAYLARTTLFRPAEIGLAAAPPSYLDGIELPAAELAPLDRILRLEIQNRLRNYHLARVDKLSMAVGLETRCPFLDRGVVELGLRIPAAHKRPGGRAKGLLADAFGADLPHWLLARRKQPFSVPIAAWLAGPLQSFAVDTLASRSRFTGFVDARPWLEQVAKLASAPPEQRADPASAAGKVWSLLQLEAWHSAIRPLLTRPFRGDGDVAR